MALVQKLAHVEIPSHCLRGRFVAIEVETMNAASLACRQYVQIHDGSDLVDSHMAYLENVHYTRVR